MGVFPTKNKPTNKQTNTLSFNSTSILRLKEVAMIAVYAAFLPQDVIKPVTRRCLAIEQP